MELNFYTNEEREYFIMKIVVGADSFAYPLKRALVAHLENRGCEVVDADNFSETPYFDVAVSAAEMVSKGDVDCGLLLCGTGAGMCIVSNKVPGIRAVCVESVYAARKAKAINDANIITMGSMIVGDSMACDMLDAWLDTKFADGFPGLEDFLEEALKSVNAVDAKTRRL